MDSCRYCGKRFLAIRKSKSLVQRTLRMMSWSGEEAQIAASQVPKWPGTFRQPQDPGNVRLCPQPVKGDGLGSKVAV